MPRTRSKAELQSRCPALRHVHWAMCRAEERLREASVQARALEDPDGRLGTSPLWTYAVRRWALRHRAYTTVTRMLMHLSKLKCGQRSGSKPA